jgi:hypothetical protein
MQKRIPQEADSRRDTDQMPDSKRSGRHGDK